MQKAMKALKTRAHMLKQLHIIVEQIPIKIDSTTWRSLLKNIEEANWIVNLGGTSDCLPEAKRQVKFHEESNPQSTTHTLGFDNPCTFPLANVNSNLSPSEFAQSRIKLKSLHYMLHEKQESSDC